MLQPRKSNDGSFVQLVRVSLNAENLSPVDTLDVKLEFNAIGGTRLEDMGTYQDSVHEWMGHKTIRGDWKLAFQANKNLSDREKPDRAVGKSRIYCYGCHIHSGKFPHDTPDTCRRGQQSIDSADF